MSQKIIGLVFLILNVSPLQASEQPSPHVRLKDTVELFNKLRTNPEATDWILFMNASSEDKKIVKSYDAKSGKKDKFPNAILKGNKIFIPFENNPITLEIVNEKDNQFFINNQLFKNDPNVRLEDRIRLLETSLSPRISPRLSF